jgi:hypothetical protein
MSHCFSGSSRKVQRNNSKIQDDGRADVSFDDNLKAKLFRKIKHEDKDATRKNPDEIDDKEPKRAIVHFRSRKDDFVPDLQGFEGVPRMNIAGKV